VRAGEAGDRIDEEHDVAAGFDEALGPFDAELADADVVLDLLVVGGGPDLGGRHAAAEVGHLLGSLVHEQNHHVALRVVLEHAQRHIAQERGLAGPGRSHDQPAGALTDRAEEVDRAGGEAPVLHFHPQVLVR
jgi:hypothetical protein